ncbi:putative 4-carboxymuconolactone decarboxylase [Taphrina deformans PYCC 5710]|uniref:4-carboxymuconolactone decarboxylase n=1 Tax=Taphrina deformans (strain PYCC 5710 / ATCC 11124 / CBS 356.35 / IMI 108563 / JCM 9778 / NBRC 8474) TaxID=1097556 RepID=R4XAF1_TAPDE|nr:putative 4-carboxymuconolactone decarboxylase [Taphrina deformans PYCC 5710]|eukprot:CCG82794.1 putative 4-carboxymuconolactone decarboxylase [Taphrina deformans PYCC 5710]
MGPRIPYVDKDIRGPVPEAIRARRKGSLLELDRTLLRNPAIAAGWNALLDAEVAICLVAVINGAAYEWAQHAPLAIDAGVSPRLMDSLKRGDVSGFDERHRLVLRVTRAMTDTVVVEDALFQEAVDVFGHDVAHDLVAIVATYNMVSRYLVALKVGQ